MKRGSNKKMMENEHSSVLSSRLLVYERDNIRDKPKKMIRQTEYFIADGSENVLVFHGVFDARKLVAVKRIQKNPRDETTFTEEARLLLKLSGHPNILRYYWIEANDDFYYIATELCQRTLDDHLKLFPANQHGKGILLQLTRAVAYLHDKRIVHRDIKPDNIFIAQNYDHLNKPPRIKLADFGKSILLLLNNNIDYSFDNIKDSRGDPQLGTTGWQAPEINRPNQDRCDLKIDTFSLGLVFAYTLTKRRHPFDSKGEESTCGDIQTNINELNLTHKNIDKNYLGRCRTLLGDEAFELIIENMLLAQPVDRFTSRQVLDDNFFRT